MKYLLLLVFILVPFAALTAQPNGIEQNSEFLTLPAGDKLLRWHGESGRSYFIQVSDQNNPLAKWFWAPVIEAGNDDEISYEVDGTAGRAFFRLKYIDQTASPGLSLEDSDFDNDGLSNIDEIDPPAPAALRAAGPLPPPSAGATDPTNGDSDGDGMGDGFERNNGFDPNNSDENGDAITDGFNDTDNDGMTNSNEQSSATNPNNAADFPVHAIVAMRHASGWFDPQTSVMRFSKSWAPADDSEEPGVPVTPASLKTKAETGTYPAAPPPGTAFRYRWYEYVPAALGTFYLSGDGSSGSGAVQQSRIWLKAPAVAGARTFSYLRYTEKGGSTAPDVTRTVEVDKFEVPAGMELSAEFVDVETPAISEAGVANNSLVGLIPVDIVPASGMSGVTGDVVPSNKTTAPEKHYVSPKLTAEIPATHVILQATGIDMARMTPGDSNQIAEWTGGEAVPGNPLQRRVSRATAGKTVVTIKTLQQYGGEEVEKINVWVVWATLETIDGTPKMMDPVSSPTSLLLKGKINFRYTCQPESMFDLTLDVPDLSLPWNIQPSGGKHPWTQTLLAFGAQIRVDASRQFRVTTRSNDSELHTYLQTHGPDVVSYPDDPATGNDDPNVSGELRPYLPQGITARMSDLDNPSIEIPHVRGAENAQATISEIAQFRQFARIQVGKGWFLCSEYFLSEVTFKAKRLNNLWVDDSSTFVIGNSQFPPP